MKIEKIYFDLDGVLSDFWGGLKEMCGEVDASEMDNVWDAIRPIEHYYSKLKPIEGSIEMIQRFIEKYGDKCEILSAIPSAKKNILYAEEDKRAWVAKYIGPEIKVNIVQRAEKVAFCQGPGCVLIDDFPKNVDEWESIGGTAFLFDKSMPEEVEALNENLTELTDEELEQVAGGSGLGENSELYTLSPELQPLGMQTPLMDIPEMQNQQVQDIVEQAKQQISELENEIKTNKPHEYRITPYEYKTNHH